MPETRNILLIALAVVAFMLWSQWQQDQARQTAATTIGQNGGKVDESDSSIPRQSEQAAADMPDSSAANSAVAGDNEELPDASVLTRAAEAEADAGASSAIDKIATDNLVRVRTDVLDIHIDLRGGTIVQAVLRDFPVKAKLPDVKVRLMNIDQSEYYVAQAGLLSADQPAPTHLQDFNAAQNDYQLDDNDEELQVTLTWQEAGISAEKIYTFRRNSYVIDVEQRLINNSSSNWQGFRYAQLQRSEPEAAGGGLANTSRYSFNGAVYYTSADRFDKLKFGKFAEQPLRAQSSAAWVGLSEHYFLSAIIPPVDSEERMETTITGSAGNGRYLIRTQSPAVEVAPGRQHSFPLQLFIGPKGHQRLEGLAPGLELTVDYGIFTIFSKPLFWALDKIHIFVGNWGWSIVILTVLIKLAFFKLTEAQYRSMARMRKLQPRIEKLKERYGDDRQKMSQAMMEMYRTEKVNPLGGCLPILIQIPIFIALYWVLLESVELRQAPFFGWIQDLSSPDPWFILPIINGTAMIVTQRLTPMVGMDPMQRKIMSTLPIVFSIMFAFFPAGLVLYWATNASISLAQQWVITKRIEKAG